MRSIERALSQLISGGTDGTLWPGLASLGDRFSCPGRVAVTAPIRDPPTAAEANDGA
jgi:hypothetical protein